MIEEASMVRAFIKKYNENLIWSAALVWLYGMNIDPATNSFCIFSVAGFSSCPGCGIGHSIHYVLHLDFPASFKEHWLGLPATLFLIIQIFKPFFYFKFYNYHGPTNANDAKRHTTG